MKKLLLALLLVTNICFADTLTVYPAAGSNSPVDGQINRAPSSETFSAIRAAGGNTTASDTAILDNYLQASATTNEFLALSRSYILFDGSSLEDDVTVNTVTLSIRGGARAGTQGLGTDSVHVVSSTPASNSTLATGDYVNIGSTSFGSIAISSLSNSAYNDFTLNASGISNFSLTTISKYGTRLGWDRSGTFGGSWGVILATGWGGLSADTAGTTSDPKLTIDYTPVAVGGNSIFFGTNF